MLEIQAVSDRSGSGGGGWCATIGEWSNKLAGFAGEPTSPGFRWDVVDLLVVDTEAFFLLTLHFFDFFFFDFFDFFFFDFFFFLVGSLL